MKKAAWQLSEPLDALIFDCDGTLSSIEGIDELAKLHGIGPEIEDMTAVAMTKTGMMLSLYQERLERIKPRQDEVLRLGQTYIQTLSPDAKSVIEIYQRLGKALYIVSAGLYPAVMQLSEYLAIPRQHLHAVEISFDSQGHYLDFDHQSPLVTTRGKRDIVRHLLEKHSRVLYLGDGMNDYETHDLVTRFVGYGGAYYRPNIEALCSYYLKSPSFLPLLGLSLTGEEIENLDPKTRALVEKGIKALNEER